MPTLDRGAEAAKFFSHISSRLALLLGHLFFDSIVIPGRKLPSQSGPGGGREMNVEEYVIFDGVRVVTRVSRSVYRRSGAFRSCAQ